MRESRVGADRRPPVERISELVARLAADPHQRYLTLEIEAPGEPWVQVALEGLPQLNFWWPYDEHPILKLLLSGVDPPEGAAVQKWEPFRFCGLFVIDPTPSVVAGVVDRLVTNVYGCEPGYRFRASFGTFGE